MGGYNNSYINLNFTEFSITHIAYTFFRWCGQIGDTLFVVVTAWFLCDSKRVKLNKPIRMVLDAWVLSICGLVIAIIYIQPSMIEIIHSLLPIRYRVNWFVSCYIIYYLIHPLLNKAVSDMSEVSFKNMVRILFITYSLVGTFQQEYYFTNLVGFVCIHYFVMYYKRGMYRDGDKTNNRRTILVALLIIILWIVVLNFAGQYKAMIKGMNLLGCTFMNPLIICIGVAVLDISVRSDPVYNMKINRLTKYSLIVYLIHANYFWLTYGKYALINKLQQYFSLFATVVCMIILYTTVTPILSWIYDRIFNNLLERISNKIEIIIK